MRLCGFLCVLMFATSSAAGDLAVTVKTAAGRPVADAVVMVYPATASASIGEARFDWPMRMVQQNLQFHPFVLIVPQGATVAFPNLDSVRHHVYSFSPAHPFELKLYGREATRTVKFDRPGAIALGCNIHDQMIAFIRVVDTPYAAKTGATGQALVRDLPDGAATLRVWHPYLKAPGNEIARPINLHGGGGEVVSVEVRNVPERVGGY